MFNVSSILSVSKLALVVVGALGFDVIGSGLIWADGKEDNDPTNVRTVPPIGIELKSEALRRIDARVAKIRKELSEIDDLDDISFCLLEVIPRAVEISVETRMIYREKELDDIAKLFDEGERRLSAAKTGQRGRALLGISSQHPTLVVAGFRSKLDNSVQPFGLELPQEFDVANENSWRLDVWLHGRAERVSEVAFLTQRRTKPSQYRPANTIVLHPYGRYSNAFKFAGEIDVLEATQCVQSLFNIDKQRIAIRGFSMGGAGCWQLAVHYPDIWAAANPGAGFSETTEFLREYQGEKFVPTDYQRPLLHWYDCPDWTANLAHVPTVAYSGEIDQQKQAADVMEAAYAKRGMTLPHILGPNTAHKIHEDSKPKVQALLNRTLDVGKPTLEVEIDFTTYSLRYNKLGWLTVEGLEQHWNEARVRGRIVEDGFAITTHNVNQLTITIPPSKHFAGDRVLNILIDNDVQQAATQPDGSLDVTLRKDGDRNRWQVGLSSPRFSKTPRLQGSIDDAFMGPFLFVGPDSSGDSPIDHWVKSEFSHARTEWRRHFRGDVLEKAVANVTEEDILNRNLILFGTPETNALIAKISSKLPIKWEGTQIQLGKQRFAADKHAVVMIYPNPLHPERYVVLNSGFTYREYAYLNNARQIPMLPDWAIVDITDGSTTQFPGEVKSAGFFNERWQLGFGND